MTNERSSFDLYAAELARLGVVLTRLPGEYRVNFRAAGDATARIVETIDEALVAGREMAAEAPKKPPVKKQRQRRYMSAKAARRAFIKAHNRRMRGRAIKQQRDDR